MRMKNKLLLFPILLLVLAITNVHAQVTFQKTYGAGKAQAVQQTNDGGFILIGYAEGNTTGISLVKTDSLGAMQWSKFYTSGNSLLYGFSVQQSTDSGYIITGNVVYYPSSLEDIILIKTTANGTLQWQKSFNTGTIEYGLSVLQCSDGGYVVSGYSYADVILIKTASGGNLQWIKSYSGSNSQQGRDVKQTSDGGFIITGNTTFGAGSTDLYLLKTDSSGTLEWTRTVGGAADSEFGNSVLQTADGGYVAAGSTGSFGAGARDVYLVKTAADGTLLWTSTFGGSLSDEGFCVQQTHDGGYIITGRTGSFGSGNDDVYLVKTDSAGVLQWTKTYGGTGAESGKGVIRMPDGGYTIAAFTTSSFSTFANDMYMIRTDSSGNSGCYETAPVSASGTGGVAGTGGMEGTAGTAGNLFVQVGFGGASAVICPGLDVNEAAPPALFSVYPNPFSDETTLRISTPLSNATLTVYNAFGKHVREIKTISRQSVPFSRGNLPAGVYVVRLMQNDTLIATEKLIICDN